MRQTLCHWLVSVLKQEAGVRWRPFRASASVKVQSAAGHSVTDQFALKEPEDDTTVCAHHRHTAQLCRKYLKLCVRSMPLCCFISNLLIYFPLTESARETRGVAVELRDTGSSAAPCGICTHTQSHRAASPLSSRHLLVASAALVVVSLSS